MNDNTMPAAEATAITTDHDVASYELAYHVLPTVAEGEVSSVSDELKHLITTAGGEIFDEEGAKRFELAYEIEKYLEGRYRRFTSAYFGWVRFRLSPAALAAVTEGVDEHKQLLRQLMVRLTKVEEVSPFRFHDAIEEANPRVTNVSDGEVAEVVEGEVDIPVVEDAIIEIEADDTPKVV